MDLFNEIRYLRNKNYDLKKKYPNVPPLSARNSTSVTKLGILEQQREDERYEEITKNAPLRGTWFGAHKVIDEALEKEAELKAKKEAAAAIAAREATLAAEEAQRQKEIEM